MFTSANMKHVWVLVYDTNLILHALGSAGAGAGVWGRHSLLLVLLLQLGVLGVHTLHTCWRMQELVRLLHTLKEKPWDRRRYNKACCNFKSVCKLDTKYLIYKGSWCSKVMIITLFWILQVCYQCKKYIHDDIKKNNSSSGESSSLSLYWYF